MKNRSIRRIARVLAAMFVCAAFCAARTARADSVDTLQLDLNNISLQSTSLGLPTGFNPANFSGNLVVDYTPKASMKSVMVNGVKDDAYKGKLVDASGSINFLYGSVIGGTVELSVLNPNSTIDTCWITFLPGQGGITKPASAQAFNALGYQIDGQVMSGGFKEGQFGGMDVSKWKSWTAGPSKFLAFKFLPDCKGYDSSCDLGVKSTVTPNVVGTPPIVPLPPSGAAAAALMTLGAIVCGIRTLRRRFA